MVSFSEKVPSPTFVPILHGKFAGLNPAAASRAQPLSEPVQRRSETSRCASIPWSEAAFALAAGAAWGASRVSSQRKQRSTTVQVRSEAMTRSSDGTATLSRAGFLVPKGKGFGYDPNVLRGPNGEILSNGDAPEPEGAAEFFDWLRSRGCEGLESVQLLLGGGLALRASAQMVDVQQVLVEIPHTCFLTPKEGQDMTSLEELAWRLLLESWAGDASEFAPLIRRLRKRDLSTHPNFWDEEELEWLKASAEAYAEVQAGRGRAEARVARLLSRATSPGSAALVPAALSEDLEALENSIRWAVTLAQVSGINLSSTPLKCLAICPLESDVKFACGTEAAPPLIVVPTPTGVQLAAFTSIKPGQELFRDGEMTNAEYLAFFGVVPGSELPGIPSAVELLDANFNNRIRMQTLPIPITGYDPANRMDLKLKLLKKYLGLNLDDPRLPSTPVEEISVPLPEEPGMGRLMPVMRFLLANLESVEGDQDLIHRIAFNIYFQHCELPEYPEADESLLSQETLTRLQSLPTDVQIEVFGSRLLMDWVWYAIMLRADAIPKITEMTGIPSAEEGFAGVVQPGQIVMAHFKAKRADGSVAKSRDAREAKVLTTDKNKVRLEFIGNQKRHEVPWDWVVGLDRVPSPQLLQKGCTPARLARGKVAMTLLRAEEAMLGIFFDLWDARRSQLEEWEEELNLLMERGMENMVLEKMAEFKQWIESEQTQTPEADLYLNPNSWRKLSKEMSEQMIKESPDGVKELKDPEWVEPEPRWNLPSVFAPPSVEFDLDKAYAPVLETDKEEPGAS